MKVGDLVKTIYGPFRRGILIERVLDPQGADIKVFKVLWIDGTTGNNVWDYDLEKIA